MDGTGENVKTKRGLQKNAGFTGSEKVAQPLLAVRFSRRFENSKKTSQPKVAVLLKTPYFPAMLLAIPAAMGISNFSC